MTTHTGGSKSVWEDVTLPRFPKLSENVTADICVVGGGIAGLAAACELSRRGRQVVVLEAGQIGGGETSRTTAHVTAVLDDRFSHLESLFGAEGARTAAASHTAAINYLRVLVDSESIDCDLENVTGYLLFSPEGTVSLPDELEASVRAGFPVRRLPNAPLSGLSRGECLEYQNQAQFHPLKFLKGLTDVILRNGGAIYEGSRVIAVEDATIPTVQTENGRTVSASEVIVATNSPINDRVAIHTKQAPYRTYVVAFDVPPNSIEPALYWDTEDPYHYVRIARTANGDRLIVGGEDHKTAQAHDSGARFARLEDWTRERFPQAGTVTHRWSGQVMEPVDGMAYIGRNPGDRHVFIATGDSGNGMTHGLIAGYLIPDLIDGRLNPAAELYDPARKPVHSLSEYVKENANVVAQFRDYVTSGDVVSVENILPGEGAVIRRGLHKIAAYRDPAGQLHECSAVCTHVGCVVAWNSLEKCWDCPCHGSRFDPLGAVIAGPAHSPLAVADREE